MLAKEEINVLFMFGHDRGNSFLLFLDNLAQDSYPLDLEMVVSRSWEERHIVELCN